jgi:hypothetical protein
MEALFNKICNLIFLFIFIFLIPGVSLNAQEEEGANHNNLKLGERLFNGFTGSGKNPVNCAACHNTHVLDTLNWSPSAVEIALSTKNMDSAVYANLMLNPVGKRLSVAHEGIELTGEEIELIREFVDEVGHTGLIPKKININRMLFFLFLILLAALAVADLIFFKAIKFKVIPIIIFLLSSGWGTKMIVQEAIALGRSQDYTPIQPVKFSHVIHAGENEIDCQYCHHTAEYSKSAGIPSMNVCMNCHTLVRDATRSGKFEINKIHAAVDSGKPIEWIRIHRLPDFVYFNHSQHVGVGELECSECHGPVEEMHVLQQYEDLSMGWCLDCHRSRKVNFIENEYYKMTYKKFHELMDNNTLDSILVEDIGGTDCMKCHY